MKTIDQGTLDEIVHRMLGADEERFFQEHWQQVPLVTPNVDPEGILRYSVEQLMSDLVKRSDLPTERSESGTAHVGTRFMARRTSCLGRSEMAQSVQSS